MRRHVPLDVAQVIGLGSVDTLVADIRKSVRVRVDDHACALLGSEPQSYGQGGIAVEMGSVPV
jgi:hypothetical protein